MSTRGDQADGHEHEEFQEAFDRACIERGVRPVRADGRDSWGQIQFDFPALFGRSKPK